MDLQSLRIDRRPRQRSGRGGARWPARLGLLLLLGAAAWLFWPGLSSFADRLRLPEVRTMVVRAPSPAAAAATTGTGANGYVVAARRAALSSDVPGRIVEMLVTEGAVVKRGDVVARLFSDEYRTALERAQAELGAAAATVVRAQAAQNAATAEEAQALQSADNARALLAEATAQLQWQQREFDRVADLVQREITPGRELERVRGDRDAQQARMQAATAMLRSAEAAVAAAQTRVQVAAADLGIALAQQQVAAAAVHQAQATLDKTDVRAPFDGIVVLKDAEVGEVVSPNSQGGSNARGAVCTMVDFASLEVQANVPEVSLAAVALQAPADVFLDAFPDERLRGVVDRIWPTADRQKATVEVRVRLLDRPAHLRPEMGVRVVFRREGQAQSAAAETVPAAVLVPETAIVEAGGQAFAFVVERDVVRAAAVTVGERRSGRAAVAAGLRPGQRIVIEPPAKLRDGDRVRLVDG